MTSALTLGRFGRYRTSADTAYTTVSAGTLRTTHQGAPSAALWVVGLGAWMGRNTGSTPTVYLGLHYAGTSPSGTTPSTRMGISSGISAATDMTSASGGAKYEAVLQPGSGTYVGSGGVAYSLLVPGSIYAIGALPLTYDIGVATVTGGGFTTGNNTLYNKSGLSAIPDPFVPSSSSAGYGRMDTWAYGWENEAPLAPASMSPLGTVYSLTPTFEGSFRDLNGAYGDTMGTGLDTGDVLNQFRIQVRGVGETLLLWNATLTATGAEQTANLFSRTYAGTTLIRGVPYEWRAQVSDQAGEWGDWSGWQAFTPADAGVITCADDPTGKLEVNTGISFEGKWTHISALAMEEVVVRLYDAANLTLLQTSGVITKAAVSSASPGTLFTVTWAETGFDDLGWGRSYYYKMSGKDSDDVWTNYYSSPVPGFTTNAAPSVPSSLQPNNAAVYTNPPKLSATWTDADDTTATGLTGFFLCQPPDLDYDVAFTATYNATTERWEYQLTESNLSLNELQIVTITSSSPPSGGTFTLTFDGQTTGTIAWDSSSATVKAALDALSNITTVNVTKDSSTQYQVTFNGSGMTKIDQPQMTGSAAGLTGGSGHSIVVTTSVDGGVQYGEWTVTAISYDGTLYSGEATSSGSATVSNPATFIYADGVTVTIDTPADNDTITTSSFTVEWTTTDQQKYQVILYLSGTSTIAYDSGLITSTTSEHLIPSGSYANDTAYDLYVMAQDSLLLEGSSSIDIDIDYAPATALTNVQAFAVYADSYDPVETAIMVTHDPTEYPLVDSGSGAFMGYLRYRSADSGPDQARIQLHELDTNPSSTTFVDYTAASGYEYTYEVYQQISYGGAEVLSTEASDSAELALGQYHVLTRVGSGGTYRAVLTNVTDKGFGRGIDEAVFPSLAGGPSVTVRGRAVTKTGAFTAALIADSVASAEARLDAFLALDADNNTSTNLAQPVCYRDGTGRKLFGMIIDATHQAMIGDDSGVWYQLAFGLRQESVTEGVS